MGSEREFDEVPNWRGLQDFVFLIEIRSLGDCHRSAANPPRGVEVEWLLGRGVLPSCMDDTASRRKSFILGRLRSFPEREAFLEGHGLPAVVEICGGGRNKARPERARRFEALGERQLRL